MMRILGWILRLMAVAAMLMALLLAFGGDWGAVAVLGIGGLALWGGSTSLVKSGSPGSTGQAASSENDYSPTDFTPPDFSTDAPDSGGPDF